MMKIQFNTDKTISGEKRNQDYFSSQIEAALGRYQSDIAKIEVHISNESGKKEGINEIRCLFEVRLEGKQPIAVICKANSVELAVSGAIDKTKTSLETLFGRENNH